METQYNLKSPSVKRLMKEAQELHKPTEQYHAQPLNDNLFEWHFTIRGPEDSEFSEGIYHGRILLPPDYPMKPPSIILLTANGRFETHKKICLSISGHHPESWQPSWSIRTALMAIIGFMPTHGNGAIGSLDYTADERKKLARKTRSFKCAECGEINQILLPVTEASKGTRDEAKKLASQINFQAEKPKTSNIKNDVKTISEANTTSTTSAEQVSTATDSSKGSQTTTVTSSTFTSPQFPSPFPWPTPNNPVPSSGTETSISCSQQRNPFVPPLPTGFTAPPFPFQPFPPFTNNTVPPYPNQAWPPEFAEAMQKMMQEQGKIFEQYSQAASNQNTSATSPVSSSVTVSSAESSTSAVSPISTVESVGQSSDLASVDQSTSKASSTSPCPVTNSPPSSRVTQSSGVSGVTQPVTSSNSSVRRRVGEASQRAAVMTTVNQPATLTPPSDERPRGTFITTLMVIIGVMILSLIARRMIVMNLLKPF